jgi:hypothetical protein
MEYETLLGRAVPGTSHLTQMLNRRNKMVSFRLSPDEYRTWCQACSEQGMRSVSELARTAVQALVKAKDVSETLDGQLQDLRSRVEYLTAELGRVSRQIERAPLEIPGATSNAGSVE